MTHFRILIACSLCFIAGFLVPNPWSGSVKVYTNVNDGTPLNHGQKYIQIKLPSGERFSTFGGCGPQWIMESRSNDGMYWNALEVQVEKMDLGAK